MSVITSNQLPQTPITNIQENTPCLLTSKTPDAITEKILSYLNPKDL